MEDPNRQLSSLSDNQSPFSIVEFLQIPVWLYVIFVLVAIFILYDVVASSITAFVIGSETITKDNVVQYRIAMTLGQIIFLLLPTLIFSRLQTQKIETLFRPRSTKNATIISVLIALFAFQQLLQVYMYFQDMIPLPPGIGSELESVRSMIEETQKLLVTAYSIPELMAVIFVVAFVPAICEEFLFRGFVQSNLERSYKIPMVGVVTTGCIFGLYHFNPISVVPLIALGVFFGYIVFKSGSIVVSVVAHFFNNTIAIMGYYFHFNDEIAGSTAQENNPLVVILVTFVFFLMMFVFSMIAFHKSLETEIVED